MQINIRRLLNGGEQTQDVSGTFDLSSIVLWGEKPFVTPVTVQGQLKEQARILSLKYTATGSICFSCARCLVDVPSSIDQTFEHTLTDQAQDMENDTMIVLPDGILHLDELVTSDLCLYLNLVTLCEPDCKGICPICGANLNTSDCNCSHKTEV